MTTLNNNDTDACDYEILYTASHNKRHASCGNTVHS